MKKIIFAALLVPSIAFADGGRAVAASSSSAKSSADFYVRADIGADKLAGKLNGVSQKFKVQPVYKIGAGYIFDEYFRADLNLRFKGSEDNKAKTVKAKSTALFLNGYVDLPNSTMFSPYATVGMGAAKSKFKQSTVKLSKTTFAYNAGLGVRAKIQDNLFADLGYRYNNLGNIKKAANKVTQHSNEVALGLAYAF